MSGSSNYYTEKGAITTIKALELGAVDFFLKSSLVGDDADTQLIKAFISSLKTIVEGAKLPKREEIYPRSNIPLADKPVQNKSEILIIGCSTGGPSALQSLLPRFTRDISIPILVIQHMPPGFTGPLAERFDSICNLHVKEAENGDVLEAGNIYIAPAGYQTYLNRKADGKVILKIEDYTPIETLYKPSVDVTLLSSAQIYGDKLVTVIMTGMGNDGLMGCGEVKKQGGKVIVEAEESCIVYGMPKVVYEAGLADSKVPLYDIYYTINRYI